VDRSPVKEHRALETNVDERGDRGRTGQSASRIVLICAIFVAVLSSAWLIGREFIGPSTLDSADRYRLGVVQLRCEKFELDNETGVMRPKGVAAQCDDVRTALPSRSGAGAGPAGRLNGISEHFKPR
jgi:hypothetical protein